MTRTHHLAARRQFALLGTYLCPQWRKALLLTVLLFANIGLQLANPLILRRFIDAAIARQALDTLVGGGVLFLVVALLAQGVAVAEAYVAEDLGWTATNALRADLTRHLLGLDMRFHTTHTPGELIERVDGDVTALANFFSRFVLLVAGNIVLLGGVLVMFWREDARVGLAMTAFAVVALTVLARARRLGVAAATADREAHAALFGFLEERLAGLHDIRANGAIAFTMRRLYEKMCTVYDAGCSAIHMQAVLVSISLSLWTLGYLLAMALGAGLFGAGLISLGTVYLVLAYTDLLRRPLDQITNQIQDLQKAGASTLRILELYALLPAILDGPSADVPLGPLAVAFEGVTFGYQPDRPVLADIDFALAPGRVLGVVGRTGSGKSTLGRLLVRLYDPQAGSIRLGGADTRAWRLADLRRRVGVVTQEVQLFRASVRDNLTLFDATISDARILTVIHELGLADWYRRLPTGLDSELEAGGGGLSAGQAQLLAFTRVFLCDPGLVILDEASSRLDPATERLIEEAVARLLRGRTAIIIAHRLGTLARADEILVLDRGRVVEHGARAERARDPGSHFYHLLRTGLEEVRT